MTKFTLVGRNHMNLFNAFYAKAFVMLSKLLFKLKEKSLIKRNKFAMNTNVINNTMTQVM